MDYVVLNHIEIDGQRCIYDISYPDSFAHIIKDPKESLYVEFPETVNLQNVPEQILAIPFLGNVYFQCVFLGLGIQVPIIDRQFYQSLPNVLDAFRKMFPYLKVDCEVLADQVVDTVWTSTHRKSLFFTGGLDATSALIETHQENPLLINIWGGDISTQDNESHGNVEQYFQSLCRQMSLEYCFLKTNAREYYKEWVIGAVLKQQLRAIDNHGWWASVTHILSMTSTVAPLMYALGIEANYIGATYEAGSSAFDANNDAMVMAIKYGNCQFVPVDSTLGRTAKAHKIVEFCRQTSMRFELKVCWYRKAGINCCQCEKCYRTILDILSAHGNPNDYGFAVNHDTYLRIKHFLKNNEVNEGFWQEIIDNFKKDAAYWQKNEDISWILSIRLNRLWKQKSLRQIQSWVKMAKNILRRIYRRFFTH